MLMPKKTQKQQVLQHLNQSGTITSWEAIQNYRCTRLADVIFRLKEEYEITTEMIGTPTGCYAKYRLIGKKVLN